MIWPFLAGLIAGFILFPVLMFLRSIRSDEWDDSNPFNMWRVLAHIALHPGDLAYMHYIRRDTGGVLRSSGKPFGYISGDEFSQNMRTRPPKGVMK